MKDWLEEGGFQEEDIVNDIAKYCAENIDNGDDGWRGSFRFAESILRILQGITNKSGEKEYPAPVMLAYFWNDYVNTECPIHKAVHEEIRPFMKKQREENRDSSSSDSD